MVSLYIGRGITTTTRHATRYSAAFAVYVWFQIRIILYYICLPLPTYTSFAAVVSNRMALARCADLVKHFYVFNKMPIANANKHDIIV